MLFSSVEFLFVFLPVCLLLGFFCHWQKKPAITLAVVLLANLVFYAWFRLNYVPILIGSIGVNYLIGRTLIVRPSRIVLYVGVAVNLILLGFFKYAAFVSSNLGMSNTALEQIVLPLAISFYTFQQISFIVDCKRGMIKEVSFFQYAVYVSFFPQLIAGPIVRFVELYPQLKEKLFHPNAAAFAAGLTLFVFGLGKKTLIADNLAEPVDAIWTVLGNNGGISNLDAWFAVFAYSFQIYFDFSAYSDMAIGLGLMLGVRLPVNFLAPYKAISIRDFWRRWHITLSRWLRDYVYIPLGGNRFGRPRQLAALFLTMALGGLWHGAGWNFIVWGCLHGIWVGISHLSDKYGTRSESTNRIRLIVAQVVTFLGVTLLWVIFRGEHGLWMDMLMQLVSASSVVSDLVSNQHLATLCVAAFIAFLLPANAIVFDLVENKESIRFAPSIVFALVTVLIFLLAVLFIIEGAPNAFIYFQF